MLTVLAAMLFITWIPVSVFAQEQNTEKEEVVYINLESDGTVKEINVVNIFNLDQDGKIVDYGHYENLRSMTTTDAIEYKNDKVTIDAKKGKLYYEGDLSQKEMPWNINIRYYMDGKEYQADQIAGMSGYLEIKMSVKKNENCDSRFFEGYALQASFTLDTKKASNIKSDGATVANVGSDKQLTYTILPNTEKIIKISADVKDFEMKEISINGIRMNLDIDYDEDKIQEKVDDVIGAVNDLDDGVGKVEDGASDLYDATGELNSGVENLYTGVESLQSGAAELSKGLAALVANNDTLNQGARTAYEGLCAAAQMQLNIQLEANGLETVTLTPDTYSDVLMGVLGKMNADKVYKEAYNQALVKVTKEVENQADDLYAGYIDSQASSIYSSYVKSQEELLYLQVAKEAVTQQLLENGMPEDQICAYLQTDEGKELIQNALSAMSEEQKEQILALAISNLTEEQKSQILQGALTSLTENQKSEIRNTYIEKMMASDEVNSQINQAVKQVSEAAEQVSALKGQLDSFGTFCNGLNEYTQGVSSAANGAKTLSNGVDTLFANTDVLKNAVGQLHLGAETLKEGTVELKEGTAEFAEEAKGMDGKVSEEIENVTSSMTGKDVEVISFVSNLNTNISSVQFVIQTDAIQVEEMVQEQIDEAEELSFWQKFLRLFGMY